MSSSTISTPSFSAISEKVSRALADREYMEKYIVGAFPDSVHDVQSLHHYIQNRQQLIVNIAMLINSELLRLEARCKMLSVDDAGIISAMDEIARQVEKLSGSTVVRQTVNGR